MRLPCPFCGLRDAAEFSYEGPADQVWPALDAPEGAWLDAVYRRDQPAGRAAELWRHRWGCRSWLVIDRDIRTHALGAVRLADPGAAAALATAPGETPGPAPVPVPEPEPASEPAAHPMPADADPARRTRRIPAAAQGGGAA